ncbi:hypothetical protein P152DRAFT_206718 [Eremomyces bilateralis CBS 781.70]|uniref:Uncharacterized protein n=1 Tax=Eremomyces bilateralis CBS 781.70 TaxID=1392243 RepID=A0A6G1FT67_9PEZI|nr:uncharacterized protein P152DRAFT_206718 [Eremomyces bilateralis CBS 781.70]KAF1808869.1 hypothetical protein P152DRAFT_206718 [Eremomyces bilateralis CBS 781.70]
MSTVDGCWNCHGTDWGVGVWRWVRKNSSNLPALVSCGIPQKICACTNRFVSGVRYSISFHLNSGVFPLPRSAQVYADRLFSFCNLVYYMPIYLSRQLAAIHSKRKTGRSTVLPPNATAVPGAESELQSSTKRCAALLTAVTPMCSARESHVVTMCWPRGTISKVPAGIRRRMWRVLDHGPWMAGWKHGSKCDRSRPFPFGS